MSEQPEYRRICPDDNHAHTHACAVPVGETPDPTPREPCCETRHGAAPPSIVLLDHVLEWLRDGDSSDFSLADHLERAWEEWERSKRTGYEPSVVIPRERIEALRSKALAAYPESAFPVPPDGEHGRTVDQCSARAARHTINWVLDALATGGTDDERRLALGPDFGDPEAMT